MVGFADLPNSKKPSRNPYRQPTESSDDPKSRSTSQDADLTSSSSKPTPVRAVFHDLHTAHSSITSGNKRTLSGRRAISHNLFEPPDRSDSIPLQKIKRKRGAAVESFLQNIPLPPPPAALFQGRYGSDAENSTPVPRSRSQRFSSTGKAEPGSLHTDIKAAFASISSPITPDTNDEKEKPLNWQRENSSLPKGTFGRKAPGCKGLLKENDAIVPVTPETGRPSRGDNDGDKSSNRKRGNSLPFDHPDLDEPPSDSLPLSSDDGNSLGDLARTKTHHSARHSLHHPYQGEIQSPIRKSSSETTPQRHSYDIQRATSTVGNIYKHYLHSSGVKGYDYDSGEEMNEESPLRGDIATENSNHRTYVNEFNLNARLTSEYTFPTALNVQKQRKVVRVIEESHGQPPTRTLPKIPTLPVATIAPSISQRIGQSSSYGDTHKLLDITQTTKACSGKVLQLSTKDLHSDEDESEVDIAAQLHVPPFPFSTPSTQPTPKVVISPADDHSVYGDDPHWTDPVILRQPLEREVSKALRRASGYSVYSIESASTSLTGQNENPRPQKSGLNFSRKLNVEDTPPSDSGSLNTEQREFVAQAQAFYDRGAIAPNWVTAQHQNVVRIPISHSINLPDSPPESPYDRPHESSEKHTTPTEAEDWETVADSAAGPFGRSKQNEPVMMMGGLVNRAGSSIADNSDDGTESTEPLHIDEYGSSDRIAQHPGNLQYYGDYRQRDLKKTHIPVFLPVFREHKVNGYLADSNRTRPPQNHYNYTPQPLGKAHVNPFKSPPPKMKQTRGRNLNLFPPSLHTSEESADFTNSNQLGQVTNQVHVDDRLRFDWTDDLGEPGLALGGPNDDIPDLNKKRSSSWQYVLALGEKIASPKKDLTAAMSTNVSKHKEINIELKAANASSSQDRKPFIKGPPGAFYRDLHMNSKHEPRRVSLIQANRPAKVPPTNALRPLALLTTTKAPATNASSTLEIRPVFDQPSTPVRARNHKGTQSDNSNDFIYRSPLAPPKRPSWQDLYSPQRLQEIRNAATADGFFESQPVLGDSNRDSRGNTWKHLFENPKLSPWSQNPAHIILEARRKRSISIMVLTLCNLFPPTLLLYATGRMDGIMVWWTDGDFSSFALKQKRYAWVLLAAWMCVIIIGLVAFLVIFFTRLHQ